MSHADARLLRGAGAILGALLIAACGTAPKSPTQSPSPTGAGETPGPPLVLEHVPDGPALRGDAVGGPQLVALPGGGFLMHRSEDMPGGGALLRSADGRTWDLVDARAAGLDAGAIVALAANGSTVMVLGTLQPRTGDGVEEPEIVEWTSADGVSWTRAPTEPTFQAFRARDIVGSARGFAALGDPPGTILVSAPDGRRWQSTDVPLAPGTGASVEQVTPTGDGFLAVGRQGGRSEVWRWAGAAWIPLRLPATDAISRILVSGGRIVVSGTIEGPDPADPSSTIASDIAWESPDAGTTWIGTGLPLENGADLGVFALDRGFLAVLASHDGDQPLTAWRSVAVGAWEPVALADAGRGWDRPLASALAVSGQRVVLAGHTVGTGGGGDRVVVWVGDLGAP